jgi:hypothetical protein
MQVIDVDSHPDTRHTLEIHCGNCGARFVAFYGTLGGCSRPARRH